MKRFRILLSCALAAPVLAADLHPFPMPWNGAAGGITNLQHWQPEPAGASGWVTVSAEGHYAVNGERIRFLGVNVGASAAFPSAGEAEGHAARLARFGFNGVRFHHLEAPWQKDSVLVDYPQGTSRELSAERLDRLHYFIAQLASRGIYTNLNLLVSREFQPADGLGAEIAEMEWKDQHILGFFHPAALELHKEYARKLLTAPNPHRDNMPLGQDPAVAFVEIMNENGLMQKWYEGVLDAMPSVYRDQLRERWNEWLASRYPSTEEMLAAWNAIDQPLGEYLLRNGDFASGLGNWNLERHQGASASALSENEFNGSGSLRLEVTNPGSANWHVQLNQTGLAVEAGKVYTLAFWARADNAVPLNAALQRAHTDWATLAPGIQTTLTAEWREYRVTWQNTVTESNARINFNGFGDRRVVVHFAGVRFQEGGKIGGVPEGLSLETRDIPPLPRSGSGATLDQRRDWTRFLLHLEKSYWDAMHGYIKGELAYPGIVFGTIVANSPANAQSGMDAFDSHSYWQHPAFPSDQPWSPENWTVQNVSMVNERNAGGLGSIARQRVAGRPHNVTEYQHPAPNTYASEGPLLAAAYGALQDWDSIWFFAYETGTAEYVTGFFDHGGHAGKMVNNLLAAAIFRRGDVAPAREQIAMRFTPEREVEAATVQGRAWAVADGSHTGLAGAWAKVNRIALAIGEEAEGLDEAPPAPADDVLAADTGELTWDMSLTGQGVVTVNTGRTKAVVGFNAGRSFELGSVRIEPGTTRQDWSTIGMTLLEGDSFDSSSAARALIVATGDQENAGQLWKDESKRSLGRNWGEAPVLIEAVPATLVLPLPPWRYRVWALNPAGERADEIGVGEREGKATIEIGNVPTMWYEVEISAAPEE